MLTSLTTQLSFTIPGAETAIFFSVLLALFVLLSGGIVEIMLEILELFYGLFRGLVGLDSIVNEGGKFTGDLVFNLLGNKLVQNIFIALLVAAVILLILSTIFKVIQSEFNFQAGGNAKSKIFYEAFKALALFAVVPIVGIFGLLIANFLLGAIIAAIESVTGGLNFMAIMRKFSTDTGTVVSSISAGAWFDVIGNIFKMSLIWPIIKQFAGAAIGVFQRMYELVILFIISPPIIALLPLTNRPYSQWQGKFVSRVFGLFGICFSVNLCLFMITIVCQDNFLGNIPGNGTFKLFYRYMAMLTGFLLIEKVAGLLSGIVGAEDYSASGKALGAQAWNTATAGVKGAIGKASAGLALGKAIAGKVGGKTSKGQEAKQALEAAKAAQKAADKDRKEAEDAVKKNPTDKAAQDRLKAQQQRADDAKKSVADARKEYRSAKSRESLSSAQKEKVADAQAAAKELENAKTDEEKDAARQKLIKARDDLKAAGVKDKQLQGKLNDLINGTNNVNDSLDNIAGRLDKEGMKVGVFSKRKQIAEVLGDKEVELKDKRKAVVKNKEELDKADKALDDLKNDIKNVDDLNQKHIQARKNSHDARIQVVDSQNQVEVAKKELEAAKASGDTKAEVKAQRKLASAERTLESNKNAQILADQEVEQTKQARDKAKEDFKVHNGFDYSNDTERNAHLSSLELARATASNTYTDSVKEVRKLETFVETSQKMIKAGTVTKSAGRFIKEITGASQFFNDGAFKNAWSQVTSAIDSTWDEHVGGPSPLTSAGWTQNAKNYEFTRKAENEAARERIELRNEMEKEKAARLKEMAETQEKQAAIIEKRRAEIQAELEAARAATSSANDNVTKYTSEKDGYSSAIGTSRTNIDNYESTRSTYSSGIDKARANIERYKNSKIAGVDYSSMIAEEEAKIAKNARAMKDVDDQIAKEKAIIAENERKIKEAEEMLQQARQEKSSFEREQREIERRQRDTEAELEERARLIEKESDAAKKALDDKLKELKKKIDETKKKKEPPKDGKK